MCDARVDFEQMSEVLGVDVVDYLGEELTRLEPMIGDGLVDVDAQGITVTDAGRLLLRNICMPFDAYLEGGEGRYSRTI
jgi:oxygen-independent coproporphyrinogen III oxidase